MSDESSEQNEYAEQFARLRAEMGRVSVFPFAENRGLVCVDGSPACAVLTIRHSRTFPGRLKVGLVAPLRGSQMGAFIPLSSEWRVELS